jgi:hypothetical protein
LYYDYLSIGLAFNTFFARNTKLNIGLDQTDAFFIIADRLVEKEKELNDLMTVYGNYVRYATLYLSKLNFRVYGFTWEYDNPNNSRHLKQQLFITSAEPERIYFTYKQKSRPAYRLLIGSYLSENPVLISLPYNAIIKCSNNTRPLKIYIQSHALKRLQERLDTQSSYYRYTALIQSITGCEMVTNQNGQILFACRDVYENLVGYFPFTIDGDNLYILSFLPLVSSRVPEGKLLCETLNTTKDDLIFLGMDKLSFYSTTDFESIPTLKIALIEAGIWHLTEIEIDEEEQDGHFQNQIGIVSKFFSTSVTAD